MRVVWQPGVMGFDAEPIRISYRGVTSRPTEVDVILAPGESWTFGRSDSRDVVLNEADLGVSGRAGTIGAVGGIWVVTNDSTKRACYLERRGRPRATVAPGAQDVLAGDTTIVIAGDAYTYRIHTSTAAVRHSPGVRTATPPTFVPALHLKEQKAVAAMAWGYLQTGSRHDPNPMTYADAARLIGVSDGSIRKPVERLRARLGAVGIPDVDSDDSRRAIVEFCLTQQLVPQDMLDETATLRRS